MLIDAHAYFMNNGEASMAAAQERQGGELHKMSSDRFGERALQQGCKAVVRV